LSLYPLTKGWCGIEDVSSERLREAWTRDSRRRRKKTRRTRAARARAMAIQIAVMLRVYFRGGGGTVVLVGVGKAVVERVVFVDMVEWDL
jgi:hypothetical protein